MIGYTFGADGIIHTPKDEPILKNIIEGDKFIEYDYFSLYVQYDITTKYLWYRTNPMHLYEKCRILLEKIGYEFYPDGIILIPFNKPTLSNLSYNKNTNSKDFMYDYIEMYIEYVETIIPSVIDEKIKYKKL